MNQIQRCQLQLGTFVEVTIAANTKDKVLIEHSQSAFRRIADIEKLMSFHDLGSELSRLNRQAHQQAVPVSADMLELLQFALKLSELTDGLFDISVAPELVEKGLLPDHGYTTDSKANWEDIVIEGDKVSFRRPLFIELGGVAKGYAVDKAVDVLGQTDCQVIVNAGGDMKMTHWQQQTVAVRVPYSDSGQTIDIEMQKPALATSGHYFLDDKKAITHPFSRDSHIRSSSVSIFADSCMLADALTKVAFLHDDFVSILKHFRAHLVEIDRTGQMIRP